MKNKFYSIGVLLALYTAPICSEEAYVTVNLTNGSSYSYLLSGSPKISYSGDSLLVRGPLSSSFLIGDVLSYNFTEGDLTASNVLESNESRIIYVDNNHVKAEGLQPNSTVTLYTTAGTVIEQIKVAETGVAEVDLPQAKGIYILKTNSQSVKLVKE